MGVETQLDALPQPLAVYDGLIARQTQTLVLKEKFLESFDIKTMDGRPWLRVKGKMISIHDRKQVFDPANNHLFDIVKKNLTWQPTYTVVDAKSKREIMEVRNRFCLFGTKLRATFTPNRSNVPTQLRLKANCRGTHAKITDESNNTLVGRINRKRFNLREQVLGHQTYHLDVAPGMDMALLTAVCICLDEIMDEKRREKANNSNNFNNNNFNNNRTL